MSGTVQIGLDIHALVGAATFAAGNRRGDIEQTGTLLQNTVGELIAAVQHRRSSDHEATFHLIRREGWVCI